MTAFVLAVLLLGSSGSDTAGLSPPEALPWVSAPAAVDSVTYYYVTQNAEGLERLYRRAPTREAELLIRYRLYPLTKSAHYLEDIPANPSTRSARELALIAALWAFRTADAPPWMLPTYGRRSERILNTAAALDSDEPYVLLVQGQSLYYKPALFGGDINEARDVFKRLREVLRRRSAPGIHPMEADVWRWMCLRKLDPDRAAQLKRDLLGQRPPALFRRFLIDPP